MQETINNLIQLRLESVNWVISRFSTADIVVFITIVCPLAGLMLTPIFETASESAKENKDFSLSVLSCFLSILIKALLLPWLVFTYAFRLIFKAYCLIPLMVRTPISYAAYRISEAYFFIMVIIAIVGVALFPLLFILGIFR